MIRSKKPIIIFIMCTVLIIGLLAANKFNIFSPNSLIAFADDVKYQQTKTKIPDNATTIKQDVRIKDQKIKDPQKVKEITPFKTKSPDIKLYGLTLEDTNIKTRTHGDIEYTIIDTIFKTQDDKRVIIGQGNVIGRPDDMLKESEKILINGIDAWVYDPSKGKGTIQIMFWDNGIYYNVLANGINKSKLIKIAESLN